ncbi:unnamed protein product [Alopecurus aequalis]
MATSSHFCCSGFKWFLSVAPRCNLAGSSSPAVCLSLGMTRPSMQLTPGYYAVAVFELSIYNHSNGMYYGHEASSNFNAVHPNSEFKHLIPLNKLVKSSLLKKIQKSSDFLHDDCCVFGVKMIKIDVFCPKNKAIAKGTTVQNLFIQKKGLIKQTYNVIINNFLQLKSKDPIRLPTFELGGHKWYLSIYPQGDQYSTGYLSLYMCLDAPDSDPPLELGTVVNVVLSILDQKYRVNHFRQSIGAVVYPGFCPLSTLNDRSRGYFVESRCVIQVEMAIVGSSNNE